MTLVFIILVHVSQLNVTLGKYILDGIFLKRLTCSLEHAALIVGGDTRLYNYVIDYREDNYCSNSSAANQRIFQEGCHDTGVSYIVAENDCARPQGKISSRVRDEQLNGLRLRAILKHTLMDREMHHPRKEEWHIDNYTHVIIDLI